MSLGYIKKSCFYIVPVLHYTLECACEVHRIFKTVCPDCVAVELPEALNQSFFRAIERLPDITVVTSQDLYWLVEPVDPAFEAIRCAQEAQLPAFCIDCDVQNYPEHYDPIPDPYAIAKIGLKTYYEAFNGTCRIGNETTDQDRMRELYMAKRLKELSFSYDTILAVIGMAHVQNVLNHLDDNSFPQITLQPRAATMSTVTEESCRQILVHCGWISSAYEEWRRYAEGIVDTQKCTLDLLKAAIAPYEQEMKIDFPPWGIELILKFCRKWAHLHSQLLPNFFQLITACRCCIDHNFAYEVWKRATEYPFLKNIDSLNELSLTPQDIWKGSRTIHFHLKQPSDKGLFQRKLEKERTQAKFFSPNPFAICSYPPEDSVIERFGDFLKKKTMNEQLEESMRTVPFSTSLEEGIDTKETIRHWAEHTLYVKKKTKPPAQVGSCVVIFDEDNEEGKLEQYPWKLTWLGEHEQESDMAFYATSVTSDIVGPGIARCQYGGFMLTSPPRRLFDVWHDPDYVSLSSKSEILLAAAIDYAVKPIIVFLAKTAPPQLLKLYAARRGKRIFYLPLSQLSFRALKKLRIFHVLDNYSRRTIADEYI